MRKGCFETWRGKTFEQRGAVLAKAASLMVSQKDAFALPVTLEMGKLFEQSCGEVASSANFIAYYGLNGADFLAPVAINTQLGDAYIESDPLGILFMVFINHSGS